MFPPGRARLVTNPEATGSSASTITIGMVRVALRAASTAALLAATITSTPRRTKSAASSGNFFSSNRAHRHAIATFCPST